MTALAPPYVLGNGDARWAMEQGGLRLDILARAEDSGGAFTLMRYEAPPGFTGPPLHQHADLDEAMLVLDGLLAVRLGDEDHILTSGDFVWMPRQIPHAFVNAGESAARFIGLVCPPGQMEAFFAAAQEQMAGSEGPPDREVLMELNARHGIDVLGPPLSPEEFSFPA